MSEFIRIASCLQHKNVGSDFQEVFATLKQRAFTVVLQFIKYEKYTCGLHSYIT